MSTHHVPSLHRTIRFFGGMALRTEIEKLRWMKDDGNLNLKAERARNMSGNLRRSGHDISTFFQQTQGSGRGVGRPIHHNRLGCNLGEELIFTRMA